MGYPSGVFLNLHKNRTLYDGELRVSKLGRILFSYFVRGLG